MPRQFFRRLSRQYRPKQASWYLGPLRHLLAQNRYFAVNRRSVTGGLWFGVFFGCQPVPVQTLLAVGSSLALRVNPAIAALAVWVSNPLTYAPILYAEYRLGTRLLGREPALASLNWRSLGSMASDVWLPVIVGALVGGALLASLAWLAVNGIWRGSTMLRYRQRLAASGRDGTGP